MDERPVCYRQHWRDARNTFGEDSRRIAVMQPELMLRFAHQNNSDYLTCPVALLQQESRGRGNSMRSFSSHFSPSRAAAGWWNS
ncbi:type VI secretion system baseplate subunit TssK [Vibrio cholerae]